MSEDTMFMCFECKICGTLDIVNKDYHCEKCWLKQQDMMRESSACDNATDGIEATS